MRGPAPTGRCKRRADGVVEICALRIDEQRREAAAEAALQARIVPSNIRGLKESGQDPVTGYWYRREAGRWVKWPDLEL